MQTTIQVDGLAEAQAEAAALAGLFIDGLAEDVEKASRYAQDLIQAQMPVDTGWAQSRWGEEAFGGFWAVEDNGLTIVQGSEIEPYEYIIRLNEGSSRQAPAGFIDAAAEVGGARLEENIDARINRIAG